MKRNLLIMCMLAFSSLAFAQGVTSSSMNGKVTDKEGGPLPGATVLAVHTPTGAEFGQVTDADGLFRIANMHVGGPYTVTVSFVGYDPIVKQGIYLELGRTYKVNTSMSETVTQLEGVIVTADAVFDGNRTGSSTIISKDAIQNTPTVTRSLADFTRLTPQASNATGGISIAGINNRFNAIYIDGAVNNDVFGLAPSGTNGGQIGISPISVDAIEQIQVVVAPYDITKGGFAGGGINAVTRSGSNKFEGSAYYFLRNESLAGLTPVDDETLEREKLDQFTAQTYGFRLGGPIIKNKAFFFVNAEIQDDQTPQPFDIGTYTGASSAADLDGLASFLQNQYGYDAGGYGNQIRTLRGTKILGRFDFNINRNHKLTVRHSYTKGESTSPRGSSNNRLRFGNGGVYFPSVTNSSALELKSAFGSKYSNNLIIGYTNVTDDRDPIGDPFPYVRIQDGSGRIELGSEQFSTANFLQQKIFTITNNFNIYKGKHTFTVGTHLEFFDMNNVFIRQNFGAYRFDNLADFLDNANTDYARFDRSYSLVDNTTGNDTNAAAKFKAMQLAFYGQDEWQMTDNFKLNLGLRIDIPIFSDNPPENQYFNNTTIPLIEAEGYDLQGATVGTAPKAALMFSPRAGFNWNVDGEDDIQIRGGIGVFTSRIPFVWPGGMYNNNGRTVGGTRNFSGRFEPDPFGQPTDGETIPLPAGDPGSGQIDIFAENFKFPQLLRSSIAVDKKLPWGLVGTAEVIWSKTLNNVFYENLNLRPSTERLTGTGDNRIKYDQDDEVDDTFTGIYLGSNTSEGYAINATFQLTKSFANGFAGSVSYTYGDSYAIFEGTSSQNNSQWRGTYQVNGRNNAPLGRSDFSMGSRFVAYGSYTVNYLKHMATTISFFYNGQSGRPFSYRYNDNSNLTNESDRERSLIYVPTDASDINLVDYDDNGTNITAAQQWAALDNYISNDKYLNGRRGQYAEKNSSRVPFTSIIDLKVAQDFYITIGDQKHTLQFTLDIFNFGNFLNKNWGRRYFSNFGAVDLLDFEGFQADNTTPEFTYNVDRSELQDFLTINEVGVNSSRWYMQIGVRYSF
ncbi:MAG: TonB-dependent receptor [Cyclobacteriaceae bacterium]|nr:TonB-dependent receptor [Cyclobacteriaceae bacterium]